MEEIEIFEQKLYNKDSKGENEEIGKIAILKGGIGASNPKAVMDKAVDKYVAYEPYTQFVDIHLDNPWVRVVIKGINDVQYVPFEDQKLWVSQSKQY